MYSVAARRTPSDIGIRCSSPFTEAPSGTAARPGIVAKREQGWDLGHHAYDAAIIGAGHNGLTAAAYLARAGVRTVVLERREIVGGVCVTEEIAPGVRASTTSYIASMLRPEIIRDLRLAHHGLRMVPCEPGLQVPFLDGRILAWWGDPHRTAAEVEALSPRDGRAFLDLHATLEGTARRLQPLFLQPPPDVDARGLRRLRELARVGRPLRGIDGRGVGHLARLLTGSLRELLDRRFESEHVKALVTANNVYGTHGAPSLPGSAIGLLFHLLSGGEGQVPGFAGHVIGGMGAITRALEAAALRFGAEVRTSVPVAAVDVNAGRARGVVLEDGTEVRARVVLSNADPKRTFLSLVDKRELPEDFRADVAAIRMDGPCAKVNLVLAEEPRVTGMPDDADPGRRALFTLLPSVDAADRSYQATARGELPDDLWVDCVVASNVDPTLAPEGRHVMTCFVQYVPYHLEGGWDAHRDRLGDRVVDAVARYAPNVPDAVVARHVLTPLDLERTYGLTEGNIFHGDLSVDQLFFLRPVPGWAGYRSPVRGLYLCGAGAHPGGGVTGAPGHNAARTVLGDLRRRRWRPGM
jgi:phytoene dehydrogenase-like protein